MSDEQSIRDEIAAELRDTFNVCGDDPGCQCEYATERSERVARHVLMPLIRRIQAEALREAADDWHEKHAGTRPAPYLFMVDRADAIERGETA